MVQTVSAEQYWEQYNQALVGAMRATQLQLIPLVYDPRQIATLYLWERNVVRRRPSPQVEEQG